MTTLLKTAKPLTIITKRLTKKKKLAVIKPKSKPTKYFKTRTFELCITYITTKLAVSLNAGQMLSMSIHFLHEILLSHHIMSRTDNGERIVIENEDLLYRLPLYTAGGERSTEYYVSLWNNEKDKKERNSSNLPATSLTLSDADRRQLDDIKQCFNLQTHHDTLMLSLSTFASYCYAEDEYNLYANKPAKSCFLSVACKVPAAGG